MACSILEYFQIVYPDVRTGCKIYPYIIVIINLRIIDDQCSAAVCIYPIIGIVIYLRIIDDAFNGIILLYAIAAIVIYLRVIDDIEFRRSSEDMYSYACIIIYLGSVDNSIYSSLYIETDTIIIVRLDVVERHLRDIYEIHKRTAVSATIQLKIIQNYLFRSIFAR